MASVVITVEREGAMPSTRSLGAIGAARRFADRHGATIYASCSLNASDDLDGWVTALGEAGCDRVAIARSADEESPDSPEFHAQIHAEITRRLLPAILVVPASEGGELLATQLVTLLGAERVENGLDGDEPPELGDSIAITTVDAPVSEQTYGADDIDVLFYEVDPDEPAESEAGGAHAGRDDSRSDLDVAEPTPAT